MKGPQSLIPFDEIRHEDYTLQQQARQLVLSFRRRDINAAAGPAGAARRIWTQLDAAQRGKKAMPRRRTWDYFPEFSRIVSSFSLPASKM